MRKYEIGDRVLVNGQHADIKFDDAYGTVLYNRKDGLLITVEFDSHDGISNPERLHDGSRWDAEGNIICKGRDKYCWHIRKDSKIVSISIIEPHCEETGRTEKEEEMDKGCKITQADVKRIEGLAFEVLEEAMGWAHGDPNGFVVFSDAVFSLVNAVRKEADCE